MGNSDDYRTRARRPLAWGALATAALGLVLSACSSDPVHHPEALKPKPTTTTSTAPPPGQKPALAHSCEYASTMT